MGPWGWLLELSPEVPEFWVPACCPSCPLWELWLLMLPKGGKELGLADGIVLPGCPEDVPRLLDDVELFPGPPPLLLLLLGREGPCWLPVLEVELDCVDDNWLDKGGGLGCVRRELSNGCDARYGAKVKKTETHHWNFVNNVKRAWKKTIKQVTTFILHYSANQS